MGKRKSAVLILLICIVLIPASSTVMGSLPEQKRPARLSLSPPDNRPQRTGRPAVRMVRGKVKAGDAISVLLDPYLPLATIYDLSRRSQQLFSLLKIKPGQAYEITVTAGRMTRFEYMIGPEETLVIQKSGEDFLITREPVAAQVKTVQVSARIQYSLFGAVKAAGECSSLAWKLAEIFAWDIDFIRDIRPGDQFQVLVEKRYVRGRFLGYGRVKAAVFTCQRGVFQAFWHQGQDGDGYYDEAGNSLQKAFLKAPLAFSRISSKFNLKRMHPILKEVRSHPGVDYAAPKGTPVKAVGDGIIAESRFSRTTGNQVTIRHPNGYITRYFHLSGFAKGIAQGRRIAQGDIIGYVGMTGYATGPHLCFRMTRGGKPVDPLTHRFPSARPVPAPEMEKFLAEVGRLARELEGVALAMAARGPSA